MSPVRMAAGTGWLPEMLRMAEVEVGQAVGAALMIRRVTQATSITLR